jgi:hypothetical protein
MDFDMTVFYVKKFTFAAFTCSGDFSRNIPRLSATKVAATTKNIFQKKQDLK